MRSRGAAVAQAVRRPRPAALMIAATAVLAVAGTVAIHRATEPEPSVLSLPVPDVDELVLRVDQARRADTTSAPTTSEAPPPSTGADSAPPPSPATVPTSTALAPVYSWTRLGGTPSMAELGPGSGLAAVVAVDGEGFLAVGNAGGHAVVLVSDNGTHWARVPEAERSLGKAVLRDLAVVDGALIAVGSLGGRPAAWSSTDALAWTPLTVAGSASSGRGLLDAATAFEGAVVAVGFEPDGPGVWALRDGRFEAVEAPADVPSAVVFADVAATPQGFAAGGNDADGRPVVWTSPDGERWHAAAIEDDGHRGSVTGVTAADGVLLAVGYDDRGPKAWSSRDGGSTWDVGAGPTPTEARPQALLAVVELGDRALGLGQGDGGPLCWSTDDGARWHACSPPSEVAVGLVRSATIGPRGLIAVGSAAELQEDAGIAIWLVER